MVPMGLSQAATVRVGLAFGRRDRAGIARAGWTAFALGVGFMSMTGLVMLAVPHALVTLFLDPAVPANHGVIRLAVSFLLVAAFFQIFDGAQVVAAGMLRGLHDTRVPMIYAGDRLLGDRRWPPGSASASGSAGRGSESGSVSPRASARSP